MALNKKIKEEGKEISLLINNQIIESKGNMDNKEIKNKENENTYDHLKNKDKMKDENALNLQEISTNHFKATTVEQLKKIRKDINEFKKEIEILTTKFGIDLPIEKDKKPDEINKINFDDMEERLGKGYLEIENRTRKQKLINEDQKKQIEELKKSNKEKDDKINYLENKFEIFVEKIETRFVNMVNQVKYGINMLSIRGRPPGENADYPEETINRRVARDRHYLNNNPWFDDMDFPLPEINDLDKETFEIKKRTLETTTGTSILKGYFQHIMSRNNRNNNNDNQSNQSEKKNSENKEEVE